MTAVLAGSLSACKPDMQDYEVKGTMQVFLRQAGNVRLDVTDLKTGEVQEIHPGRKILRLRRDDAYSDKMLLDFMDSRRVRLATIAIPIKNFDDKTESFHADDGEIKQNFGIVGHRVLVPMQREYVNMDSHECKPKNCGDQLLNGTETLHTISCKGFTGNLWYAADSRYNYEVKFMNMATNEPMATLTAVGEIHTDDHIIHSDTCLPRLELWSHQGDNVL